MGLAIELLASAVLIVVMTIVHGTGVVATTRLVRCEEGALTGRKLAFREFRLMVPMVLCLFALHTLEIALFSLFYMAVGAIGNFEEALFFSASAYATLGHPEGVLSDWRIVAAFEGLIGFMLVGWSVAVFVTDMEEVLRK